MISLILQTATRFILSLLLLFSIFVMLRGHNEPGGGFVGGLVAAAGFALYMIAYDVKSARRALRIEPHTLIGAGLMLAAASGIWSLVSGRAFMTGRWAAFDVPVLGEVGVGTPVVFDLGVYCVVMGVTLLIIFSLAEE